MTCRRQGGGFTLVEIMIVVAIIALLCAIAIPAFIQYRKDAQDSLYLSELRVMKDAFKTYILKTGAYPPEVASGICPSGMTNYFPELDWSKPAPIGGSWDWDAGVFGVTGAVSVVGPLRTAQEMTRIDSVIDDGNLMSGSFRLGGGAMAVGSARYMFVIE
jgi:prepilin-type N-terminal cleavage/methylation domain-containing protein